MKFNDDSEAQNTALSQTEEQENSSFSGLLLVYILIAKKLKEGCLAVIRITCKGEMVGWKDCHLYRLIEKIM
jgi:hypothetical protein